MLEDVSKGEFVVQLERRQTSRRAGVRGARGDAVPERRGVNSIQLFKDPDLGWRIMAMIWDNEREGVAIAPF